jgi:hypothetical protein
LSATPRIPFGGVGGGTRTGTRTPRANDAVWAGFGAWWGLTESRGRFGVLRQPGSSSRGRFRVLNTPIRPQIGPLRTRNLPLNSSDPREARETSLSMTHPPGNRRSIRDLTLCQGRSTA